MKRILAELKKFIKDENITESAAFYAAVWIHVPTTPCALTNILKRNPDLTIHSHKTLILEAIREAVFKKLCESLPKPP